MSVRDLLKKHQVSPDYPPTPIVVGGDTFYLKTLNTIEWLRFVAKREEDSFEGDILLECLCEEDGTLALDANEENDKQLIKFLRSGVGNELANACWDLHDKGATALEAAVGEEVKNSNATG